MGETSDKSLKKSDKTQEQLGAEDDFAFRGVFYHAVDEKGRVSLPVEFRKIIIKLKQESLVLTNFVSDGARCLEGFSLDSWKKFEAKLASRSRFDPQVRKVENFYLARSCVCQIDSSGRVNIPAYLRTYAGLEKDVAFTSSTHGFRIWDKRVWELVFQEAETALLENPSLFIDVDV
ncbi:MAG: division/cell wall cluster transcriptional repressor MraZ [Proteobacteria bacterium]|nr:division/cell wall cluster transcriptional repressor MraZ [Pseudomonadota bacterium]